MRRSASHMKRGEQVAQSDQSQGSNGTGLGRHRPRGFDQANGHVDPVCPPLQRFAVVLRPSLSAQRVCTGRHSYDEVEVVRWVVGWVERRVAGGGGVWWGGGGEEE